MEKRDSISEMVSEVDSGSNILIEDTLIRNEKDTLFEALEEENADALVVATNTPGERFVDEFDRATDGGNGIRVIDASGDASGDRLFDVSSPEDLTSIGVKISDLLEGYENSGEHEVCVCFDSVSTMLTMMDTETVFRFLHVATGRISNVEGFGIFGIRPAVHDSQELATIEQLFDGSVVREDDGFVFRYGGLTD